MRIVSKAALALIALAPAMPASAETSMRSWTSVEYVKEAGNGTVQQYEAEYWSEGLRVRHFDGTVTMDPDAKPTRLESPRNTVGPNSASSYADLATGKLGVAASVKGSGADYRYGLGNGYAEGIASFGDDLTFAAAGATDNQVTVVNYEAIVHGVLSGTGGWSAYGGVEWRPGGGSGFQVTERIGDDLWRMSGQTSFTGATATKDFFFQLMAYATADGPGDQSAGSANLMNTATIRFDLPTNVTMTSASGKFLSAAASNSAVPEPATWMTMILGFGVIGYALRRKTVLRFV